MKILALMQNQWFRDPERIRRFLAREPDPVRATALRRRLIQWALFAGCRSGKLLRAGFGDQVNSWIWEEASPQIGGQSSSVFPADHAHMLTVFEDVKPDLVIAFGQVAGVAVEKLFAGRCRLILCSHPTARGIDTKAEYRAIVADRLLIPTANA